MARFPQDAGAAAGLFGAARFGFGALAGVAVSLLHDKHGVSMARVILATTSLSLLGQVFTLPRVNKFKSLIEYGSVVCA